MPLIATQSHIAHPLLMHITRYLGKKILVLAGSHAGYAPDSSPQGLLTACVVDFARLFLYEYPEEEVKRNWIRRLAH